MSLKFQIVIFVSSIIFLLYLLGMIKKNNGILKYLLSWIGVLITILIIGVFPNILVYISNFLGIYDPINSLFFLGFIFVLIILYINTISMARSSEKIKTLVQSIAIEKYSRYKKGE